MLLIPAVLRFAYFFEIRSQLRVLIRRRKICLYTLPLRFMFAHFVRSINRLLINGVDEI